MAVPWTSWLRIRTLSACPRGAEPWPAVSCGGPEAEPRASCGAAVVSRDACCAVDPRTGLWPCPGHPARDPGGAWCPNGRSRAARALVLCADARRRPRPNSPRELLRWAHPGAGTRARATLRGNWRPGHFVATSLSTCVRIRVRRPLPPLGRGAMATNVRRTTSRPPGPGGQNASPAIGVAPTPGGCAVALAVIGGLRTGRGSWLEGRLSVDIIPTSRGARQRCVGELWLCAHVVRGGQTFR